MKEKGSCIWLDTCFYVIVKETIEGYCCICDYANNSYFWSKEDIQNSKDVLFISPKQAAKILSWNLADDFTAQEEEIYEKNILHMHKIPGDVILEVLVGLHDHRF